MKRGGPLKRTAFKRTKPMRRRSRSTSYSKRERFTDYMMWVKTLACAAEFLGPCDGVVEADHAGRRGIKQKAHDNTVIPLCTKHHYERGNFTGDFKRWDQATMRAWLLEVIARVHRYATADGIKIPVAVARYTSGDAEAKRGRVSRDG